MNDALRDSNKVPSMLAVNEEGNKTVPLKANNDGSLLVSMSDSGGSATTGRQLKEVIKLDLGKSRDKVLFEQSFSEITVPVIEGEFTLYIDEPEENKGLTINRALSIETKAEKFYVSNGSGKGRAEIWLWEWLDDS